MAISLYTEGRGESAPVGPVATFGTADQYRVALAQAAKLAESDVVPAAFRGKPENCLLALELATRMGASPFMVMQNMDPIHGKLAPRSTFIIACVNQSGRFSPLRYRYTGEGDSRACQAYARSKEDGEVVEGPAVSIAMAKAEGWYARNGSKWKTLPDLMLSYRAAAFFGRLYAPDIMMGMHTADEVEDIGGVDAERAAKWQPQGEPIATLAPAPDPLHQEFDALLRDPRWTPAEIKGLMKRWAERDDAARGELVAGMRAHLAPVAPEPAPTPAPTPDDDEVF